MVELVVNPWRRYGKDLLFVNRKGERRDPVAWYDRKTGRFTFRDDRLRAESIAAVKEHLRTGGAEPSAASAPAPAQPPVSPAPSAVRSPSLPRLPTFCDAEDLTNNRPGEALRAMIREKEHERAWLVRVTARLMGMDLGTAEARRGLAGEVVVGGVLARLVPAGWHVLHGVRRQSGADIDHVVIGPPGVFTVNTKHRPGQSVWVGEHAVRLNGNSTDYLRNSLSEARSTEKLLKYWCGWEVPVFPVLAMVGARRISVVAEKPPVLVIDGATIDQHLPRFPGALTPSDVEAVFRVARLRSVWLGKR